MNTLFVRSTTLLASLFIGMSASYAAGLTPSNMITASSIETSCIGANVSHRMYLPNGASNVAIQPSDNFRWNMSDPNNLAQIIEGNTRVSIWSSSASASCNTGWYRASWVIPGDGQWYSAVFRPSDMAACTIAKPATINPTQPVVQFVYKVAYKPQVGLQAGTSPYYYFLPSSPITNLIPSSTPNNTKRTWGSEIIHDNECQNYYLSYCGDGVLDSGSFDNGVAGGEQCDLGAQNGQAGSTCNASCQSIVVPACIPGTLTGPQTAPITALSPNLCPAGQAVGGFTGTTVGTLTTYNWSCNGSAVGGACAASYNSAVTGGPACSVLTASPLTGAPPLAVSFIGTGVNLGAVSTYSIVITNSGGTVLTTLPSSSGSYTFNNTGTYSAQMFINTSTGGLSYTGLTSPACTLTNSISVASACIPGTTVGAQGAPLTALSPNLCPAGQAVGGFISSVVGNTTTYNWSCNGSAVGGACAATFTTGGGGSSNVGKKCVNGVATCATYNSLIACTNDGIPAALCYAADSVGLNMCQSQPMVCSGGGGSSGFCGDGVLQSGEECDVVGAPWCVGCKINMTTNPGANPITDLWMTIPVLAGTQRIGYSWLDAIPGKIAFADNQMVLGVGTKAFTLADSVGFGIRTRYRIPLILEADKKICIKSEGTSLNSESICTSFGEATNNSPQITKWQRADGKWFVNIGAGDYQIVNPTPQPAMPILSDPNYAAKLQARQDWTPYILQTSNSPNNITLFKGTVPYSRLGQTNIGPTLNSAFFGRAIGNDGSIALVTDTGVDLVRLSVRVSSAVVSSIGSSANRSLQSFINPGNLFASFMTGTSGNTSTTSNNTTGTTTVNLPVIVGGTTGTVGSIADIERYAINGNRNILAVNGDLTIENCSSGLFTMSGIRTVIVSGKLIIKCNIGYASNDAISSWAWITKGGNIEVYNGIGTLSAGAVTNLAGVYVSVQEGSIGGNITYTGNNTTQAILRIEGSMYGNATPLFNSRLYARATGAYDILTTGTILTYSNRALVNPPPLLSQYLGAYQVQRVIQ